MKILRRDRQRGKTKLLIDWVMHDPDNRVVLLPYRAQADQFARRLFSEWMDHIRPIAPDRDHLSYWNRCTTTPGRVRELLAHRRGVVLSIDNLEEVLAVMLGQPVDLATTSDPVLEHYEANIG